MTQKSLKITWLLLLLCALSSTRTFAQYYLEAHWDFTNAFTTASDISGNGHHGTVFGATPVPNCTGQPNQALRFKPGQWVQVPGSQDFCHGEWTINIIFKVNAFMPNASTCNWSTLLQHEPTGTNNHYSVGISDYPVTGCGSYAPGSQQAYAMAGGTYPTASTPLPSGQIIAPGCWYCLTATYEPTVFGSFITIYINGTPVSSYLWPSTFGAPCAPMDLLIGKGDWAGFTTWFDGDIDDIQIWRNAMTPTDVMNNFSCPCPAPNPAGCGGTPPPSCNMKLQDIAYCTALSTPFDRTFNATTIPAASGAISWLVNGTTIATLSSVNPFTHTFSGPGPQTVCAILFDPSNGNVCDTACFEICIGSTGNKPGPGGGGATKVPIQHKLGVGIVFPNPTSDELYIPIKDVTGSVDMMIFSQDGRVILKQRQTAALGTEQLRISTNRLPSGTYFIEIRHGDAVLKQQFSKL